MLGLALEGATLVSCARVEEGMRRLDEATAAALEGEATIPISSAWTFCLLVSACVAALDFERAGEWCEHIAAFAGPSTTALLCRARLALDEGRALPAVDLIERLLRRVPDDRDLQRAPAIELLVHAHVARGELERAGAALAALREISAGVGTAALRACADLAEGVLAAGGGERERARRLFEDAVDGFERSGAPYEAARARLELATSLIALGRIDVGEREASLAGDRLLALGAAAEAQRARRILAAPGRTPLDELTPREREVVGLLAEGLTNRQIAGAARAQRAHRAPARDQPAAQARASVADGGRRPCRPLRAYGRAFALARSGYTTRGAKMTASGEAMPAGSAYRRCMAATVWALGDYHRFATQTVWASGPSWSRRAAWRRASACSTSRPAPATWRSAPPRPAQTWSPRISRPRTSKRDGARLARAGCSSNGSRPTPRRCRSRTASSMW
jgi:DNA-binding NarL/FixJ family response regulator